MSNYVTLVGTEEITRAASGMRSAAEDISRSTGYFSEESARLVRDLSELVYRFEIAVDRLIAAKESP